MIEITEAIETIKDLFTFRSDLDIRLSENYDALGLALDALREKQKRENPQPLTLEQLQERVKKPVWVCWRGSLSHRSDGWMIWDKPYRGTLLDLDDPAVGYGVRFVAYDYLPKEAQP